jgi:hypothetical protein
MASVVYGILPQSLINFLFILRVLIIINGVVSLHKFRFFYFVSIISDILLENRVARHIIFGFLVSVDPIVMTLYVAQFSFDEEVCSDTIGLGLLLRNYFRVCCNSREFLYSRSSFPFLILIILCYNHRIRTSVLRIYGECVLIKGVLNRR